MMQNCKKPTQTDPTVAVIIPFYNSNRTINRALQSVLNQTYKDLEIIICIDKNSEDPDIELNDARIRIIRNNRTPGAGVARFVAINSTKCRYIAFLDADDEWMEQKLQRQIEYMNEKKLLFCFTGYCVKKNDKTFATYKPSGLLNLRSFLLKNLTICCSSVIVDTSYNAPILEPRLRKRNDYQMWYPIIEFAMKNDYGCDHLPIVMTSRHIHENNLTKNKIELPFYNFKLYKEIFGSNSKALFYTLVNIINTMLTKIKSLITR